MARIHSLACIPLLAALGCGGEDLVLPDDSAPSRIELEAGGGQQGVAGQPLADSITVRVTDATGRPVQSAPIGVNLLDGGAVAPSGLRSGLDGRATFRWTLGSVTGPQELEVGVGDTDGITRKITVDAMALPGAVDTVVLVSGDNQVGERNSPLQDSLVVRAEDAFGNPIAGVTVDWITATGSFAPPSVPTGSDGRAATEWTLGRTTGNQFAIARVSVGATQVSANFSATALAGPPPILSITTQPSGTAVSGTALARQPVLQLRDADNTPIAVAGVLVTASVTGGTATLGGAATINTDAQGRAAFTNLALTGPAGSHTLTFTATGYLAATSQAIALVAPAPSAGNSTVSAQPTTLQVGSTSTITVIVRSSSNTPIAGVNVTLSATGTGNTLTQPSAPTNSSGVATGLLSATSSGSRTVTATVNGQVLGGVQVTFQAAGVSVLNIVSGDGQTAQVGTALPDPLVVKALDAFGNPVPNLTIQWQPSAGQATPASSTTGSNGTAQTTWTLGSGTGSQTLDAQISGTQVTATFGATATPAPQPPVLSLATQPPDTATDGVQLNPQPVVQLRDGSGGALAQAGVAVTVTIASGSATLGGTTTESTDAQGRAVFADLVLNGSTGSVTLDFQASGFVRVTSNTITLVPAGPSPAHSSFTVQPTAVMVDSTVTITVTVRSASNAPVAGATVTLSASGGNNTLTQPGPTNASGIAVGTLTSTKAETKTISAKVNGQTIGTGQQVDVQPGPASPLETTANVPNGKEDQPTTIRITTRDVYGNRLTTGGYAGALFVFVGGANIATPTVQDNGDGTYTATYTPRDKGRDLVAITLNAIPIRGSPYTSDVK